MFACATARALPNTVRICSLPKSMADSASPYFVAFACSVASRLRSISYRCRIGEPDVGVVTRLREAQRCKVGVGLRPAQRQLELAEVEIALRENCGGTVHLPLPARRCRTANGNRPALVRRKSEGRSLGARATVLAQCVEHAILIAVGLITALRQPPIRHSAHPPFAPQKCVCPQSNSEQYCRIYLHLTTPESPWEQGVSAISCTYRTWPESRLIL